MLRLLILITYLWFAVSQNLWPSMPECYFDYRILERPFIYAISKSSANTFHPFQTSNNIIDPLTSRISRGDFTVDERDRTFCTVPKTVIYVVFLEVKVRQIFKNSTKSTHSIAVGKISEESHTVREHTIARSHLPNTFVGAAFSANLTSLARNDLLFVTVDSHIQIAFDGKEKGEANPPIQLVAYMISPK